MSKEEIKLALEALESPWNAPYVDGCDLALGRRMKAITALREALAEQPAQREPLTDEEIIKCWGQVSGTRYGYVAFARAIEAAHGIKEKNNV